MDNEYYCPGTWTNNNHSSLLEHTYTYLHNSNLHVEYIPSEVLFKFPGASLANYQRELDIHTHTSTQLKQCSVRQLVRKLLLVCN